MSQQVKDRATSLERLEPRPTPVAGSKRRGRVIAVALAAVLAGSAMGAAVYRIVVDAQAEARMERAQAIQSSRWSEISRYYERTWIPAPVAASAEISATPWRIAVTGTGPGLAFVADQQAAFAERAVTGTGPGLVTIAVLQAGGTLGEDVAGTLGAEHLPGRLGSEWALVGTP
jgi:hypothetical protein